MLRWIWSVLTRLSQWVGADLAVPGQGVRFLTGHRGFPIPSPAILERIGLRFRKAVAEFAAEGGIPVIPFAKGQRKLEVMRPYFGSAGPTTTQWGGGDRGGPGVSAGVHRHHLSS